MGEILMHVLVVGGTGFLGYHAVEEFLNRHYRVTVLALPPLPIPELLPATVTTTLADINLLSNDEILRLLDDKDAFVYAAGSDDRVLPDSPAYPFFYKENVDPFVRFVQLACEAGVRCGVLLSSYFAYFDRKWPGKRLSDNHPYVRSRRVQAEQGFKVAAPGFKLMVLELPFVFGAMPGRIPLWSPLINYIYSPLPLVYTVGGTSAISAKCVGEAIVGAVENGDCGRYLVGDENITWADLLTKLRDLAGQKKRLWYVTPNIIRTVLIVLKLGHRLRGKEAGLDPSKLTEILTSELYFDPKSSREILGYSGGDLYQALKDTVEACK
jgi:nucleoside-diphosphate-sugar epimerase